MVRRGLVWWMVPALVVLIAALVLWGQGLRERYPGAYSPDELLEMIRQARDFQDNLKVALEPAFKPIALAYVRQKYRPDVSIDIRQVTVRRDGRFPVTAEVIGAIRDLYVQEKFLFWWEADGWHMRYVEGDL